MYNEDSDDIAVNLPTQRGNKSTKLSQEATAETSKTLSKRLRFKAKLHSKKPKVYPQYSDEGMTNTLKIKKSYTNLIAKKADIYQPTENNTNNYYYKPKTFKSKYVPETYYRPKTSRPRRPFPSRESIRPLVISQELEYYLHIPLQRLTENLVEEEGGGNTSKTQVFSVDSFDSLALHDRLKSSLRENSFTTLTKIQKESIPFLLNDSHKNCAIKSETGSGKTLAYLVPLVNRLVYREAKISRSDGSYVFVICPTRELCIQCVEVCQKMIHWIGWIIIGGLYGGENPQKEKARLRKGINILFATPGRLLYHLQNTKSFRYDRLEALVFEESDRILDMGFKRELEEIVSLLSLQCAQQMQNVQKILVSATFGQRINSLYLKMSTADIACFGFEGGNAPSGTSKQEEDDQEEVYNFPVESLLTIPHTLRQTYTLLNELERIPFLLMFLSLLNKAKSIVFVSTCDEVEYLYFLLTNVSYKDKDGQATEQRLLPAASYTVFKLHGNIEYRSRSETYFAFRRCSAPAVLISTDVASRGLDFPEVTHSILLDPPSSLVDYCNRVGRTARIDHYGLSLLILNQTEKSFVDHLAAGKNATSSESSALAPIALEHLDKMLVLDRFAFYLRENFLIGMPPVEYVESLIRPLLRHNEDNYLLARRAYVSFVRAYARLPMREVFYMRDLNLTNLAKSFGLGNVESRASHETSSTYYQYALKTSNREKFLHYEKYEYVRPKRTVKSAHNLLKSEFM